MSKENYEGQFSSLKHNIILMLNQIDKNIEFSEGANIIKGLEFIEVRTKAIRKKMKKTIRKKGWMENRNPAHFCMGAYCNKFIGHRGFCSDKCHDSHYDTQTAEKPKRCEG